MRYGSPVRYNYFFEVLYKYELCSRIQYNNTKYLPNNNDNDTRRLKVSKPSATMHWVVFYFIL